MKKAILTMGLIFISYLGFSQSQSQTNAEASIAYEKADAEMTKVYRELMKSLTTQNEKTLLLEAQRAWIKYKEAHCKAVSNQYEGGSMKPMILYGCLEEITNERTTQLQRYSNN